MDSHTWFTPCMRIACSPSVPHACAAGRLPACRPWHVEACRLGRTPDDAHMVQVGGLANRANLNNCQGLGRGDRCLETIGQSFTTCQVMSCSSINTVLINGAACDPSAPSPTAYMPLQVCTTVVATTVPCRPFGPHRTAWRRCCRHTQLCTVATVEMWSFESDRTHQRHSCHA